jgi:hypothetical protein
LTARSLLAGSLVIGIAVTALESVCTGQVYVPTLVLVVKTRASILRGAGYLLLYNVMFLLPLVIAFVVTYHGLKTEKLLAWSKRNVVPSKILLGLLFVVLAMLMWVL